MTNPTLDEAVDTALSLLEGAKHYPPEVVQARSTAALAWLIYGIFTFSSTHRRIQRD